MDLCLCWTAFRSALSSRIASFCIFPNRVEHQLIISNCISGASMKNLGNFDEELIEAYEGFSVH